MNEFELYQPVKTLLIKQGFRVQGEVNHLDVFGVKESITIAVELNLILN